MLFELVWNVFQGNLDWLYGLVFFNLHYLFAFAAFMYFVTKGKKWIHGTFVLILNLFALGTFGTGLGWVTYVAGFLLLNYIIKITLFVITEDSPKIASKSLLITEIAAFGLWGFYNLVLA